MATKITLRIDSDDSPSRLESQELSGREFRQNLRRFGEISAGDAVNFSRHNLRISNN